MVRLVERDRASPKYEKAIRTGREASLRRKAIMASEEDRERSAVKVSADGQR